MHEEKYPYINLLTDFNFKAVAEIAKFTPKEREAYEESLKYYRDIKNVVDTSKEEGILEGIEQGIEQRNIEIARQMKLDEEPVEKIVKYTGLSKAVIENL